MKKTIATLSTSFLLCGCVTASETYLADGSKGYNISCHGAVQSMGACIQKAGEICREKGYDVLTREGNVVPFSTSTGSFTANQYNAQGGYVSQQGAIVTRNLFVRCKL